MGLSRQGRLAGCLLLAVSWASLVPDAFAADAVGVLQRAHVWGRFGTGSWRQVRIVTEIFDPDGNSTNSSTTDNITTLEEITPERVALKVEVTVEVAGQKFPSQPQIIRQGYAGEGVGQTVSIKPLPGVIMMIGDRQIACEAEQIEILGGQSKEVSLISFSPRLTPCILRRKSIVSDAASGKTTHEALSEVIKLDESYPVFGQFKAAYRVQLVQKNDRGTTTTLSVHVPEIPGEVVQQSSEKVDSQGRLERRSKMELVGYGVNPDEFRDSGGRRKRRAKRGR